MSKPRLGGCKGLTRPRGQHGEEWRFFIFLINVFTDVQHTQKRSHPPKRVAGSFSQSGHTEEAQCRSRNRPHQSEPAPAPPSPPLPFPRLSPSISPDC